LILLQVQEHEDIEGDSVTKLHQDMSDAVNILVHAQRANGEEAAVPRNGLDLASRDGGWVGMLMHARLF
jgi:hypothetical protein